MVWNNINFFDDFNWTINKYLFLDDNLIRNFFNNFNFFDDLHLDWSFFNYYLFYWYFDGHNLLNDYLNRFFHLNNSINVDNLLDLDLYSLFNLHNHLLFYFNCYDFRHLYYLNFSLYINRFLDYNLNRHNLSHLFNINNFLFLDNFLHDYLDWFLYLNNSFDFFFNEYLLGYLEWYKLKLNFWNLNNFINVYYLFHLYYFLNLNSLNNFFNNFFRRLLWWFDCMILHLQYWWLITCH